MYAGTASKCNFKKKKDDNSHSLLFTKETSSERPFRTALLAHIPQSQQHKPSTPILLRYFLCVSPCFRSQHSTERRYSAKHTSTSNVSPFTQYLQTPSNTPFTGISTGSHSDRKSSHPTLNILSTTLPRQGCDPGDKP